MDDEPYPTLLQEKGFGGFPSLAFMDAEGNVLASPQQRSVAGFTTTLGVVNNYLDLKARADDGDRTVTNDLFLVELNLGKLTFEEAVERYGRLRRLSDAQEKLIAAQLVGLEVADLMNKVRTRQMKPDDVSATFAEMATTGRIPAGAAATDFWSLTLSHADQKEDAKLYEKALGALKKMHGDNPRNAEIFARYDLRLKELKGG